MTDKTETPLTDDEYADTPQVNLIAYRLEGRTGLFCDDESLAQYNDLLRLARQLERTLRESQKDAERYRWLRNPARLQNPTVEQWGMREKRRTLWNENLDAAIDVALPQPESQDEGGKGQ